MTTFVRRQLLVFFVLTILSLAYVSVNYLGVQRAAGLGIYTVQAHFEDASGLYPNAIVTYRGIDIGRVTDIKVTQADVVATLEMNSDHEVPKSSKVAIRSVSAIGEQYVDFRPASTEGPYLREGSSVSVDQTSLPTSTGTLLSNADALLASIPRDDLKTTIDESFAAFNGIGPALGTLIDSSQNLVTLALADIGPTTKLVEDSEPLLDTGIDVQDEIRMSVRDLNSFSEQLVMNDAQIRATIDKGIGFGDTVAGTFDDLRPTLSVMLANLQTSGEIMRVNLPNLQQILVVYPALSSAFSNVHRGFQLDGDRDKGQGPLDVKLGSSQNPAPCTEGFEDIQRRDPSDTSPMEPSISSYCTLPSSDPRAVRGARNLPCATDPTVRTAEVSECPRGLPSTWQEMLARSNGATGSGQSTDGTGVAPVAGTVPEVSTAEPIAATEESNDVAVPYDPSTGRFVSPEGQSYILANVLRDPNVSKEKFTWQDLWLTPLSI